MPSVPPLRAPARHSQPHRRWPAGAALLGLATLLATAALTLAAPTGHAVYCERMAPLGVLAVLASVLIALCFRALSRARNLALAAALLLASVSLFACARFLKHYYGPCAEVQQRLDALRRAR